MKTRTIYFGYAPSWTYYLCKWLPFIPNVEYSWNNITPTRGTFKQLTIGWMNGMWRWKWFQDGTKRFEDLSKA